MFIRFPFSFVLASLGLFMVFPAQAYDGYGYPPLPGDDHFAVVPYGAPIVDRPTTTRERYPDRDLQATLRATVRNGNEAHFTLTVENHTRQIVRDVDVTHLFHAPVDAVFILSTAGGSDRGDRITWDLGYLGPYEYRVLQYVVRFAEPHTGSVSVRTTVEAVSRSPALRATTAATIRVGGGFAYNYDAIAIPQTGISDWFAPTANASASLRPLATHADTGRSSFLAWMSVAAALGTLLAGTLRRIVQH